MTPVGVGKEGDETSLPMLGSERTPPDDSKNRDAKLALRNIGKDKRNISVLLLLYILQGIPLGLAASVPMVLQSKMIGYRQQAMFSLVSWPFSIKLLWAPIVDSIYHRSFGRRKSWLVPIQYLIGVTMIILSYTVDGLMGEGDARPNVLLLTVFFFILHFLAATQDIAVDGWALTMLSRENVGYASTCNSVGQTTGFFFGYTIFLALESDEFCNAYLRFEPQEKGILDLPMFLSFWGAIFIIVTTMILFFKPEKKEAGFEKQKSVMEGKGWLKMEIIMFSSVVCFSIIYTHTCTHAHTHTQLTCSWWKY